MSTNSPLPDNVDWQWDDTGSEAPRGREELEAQDGDRFVFTEGEPPQLTRVRPTGASIWSRRLDHVPANSAALVAHAGRLYAALFLDSATGGHIVAVESISGEILWTVRLEGVGSILHSKYANRIQLRFVDECLVAFGKESGGQYIEAFDPMTGQRLLHKRVRP